MVHGGRRRNPGGAQIADEEYDGSVELHIMTSGRKFASEFNAPISLDVVIGEQSTAGSCHERHLQSSVLRDQKPAPNFDASAALWGDPLDRRPEQAHMAELERMVASRRRTRASQKDPRAS
jgi:hypothetical protein